MNLYVFWALGKIVTHRVFKRKIRKYRLLKLNTNMNLSSQSYSFQECQKCEAFEDIEVDIEYEQNCQRLEKDSCKTDYKEVK